jgi:predicted dehydrogenase
LQDFIRAITTGGQPLTHGHEALYVQRIMARMQQSIDQGQPA